MTLRSGKPVVIAAMKTHPATLATLALCLFASPLRADEKPLREILRDGLYAEEVSRDSAAAAESYEAVLARYAEQRDFAAAALFRLAEVRRKQDRKADAIQLYQRLIAEFPQAENETKLARENLAALGGKVPEAEIPEADPESKELARLQALAKTSPDVLRDPRILEKAVNAGFPKAVAYLLAAGADPLAGGVLYRAAADGNLAIIKLLLATGAPIPEAEGREAVSEAVLSGYKNLSMFLLERGARPDSRILYDLVSDGKYVEAELLLKHGADPNVVFEGRDSIPPRPLINLLIVDGKFEPANWLLDHGAKPNLPTETSAPTPLYYATKSTQPGCVEMMERLLKAGANPNRPSVPPASRPEDPQPAPTAEESPIETAIKSGYQITEKCKVLLAHGADPNLGGKDLSPLQTVVKLGNFEVAKLLIDAGADLKKPGLLTPFLNADDESNVEKLRFLLENGADPNIPVGKRTMDRTGFFDDPFLPATGQVEEYSEMPLGQLRISGKNSETALELIRLMLDAGAKAGLDLGSIAEDVAKIDEQGDIFRRLLDQRPEKIDIGGFRDMSEWQSVPRQTYLDQVLIPALKGLPNITLLELETGKRATLAEGGEGATLPSTLELLREKKDLMPANQNNRWPELTLARRDEEKTMPFDLDADAALPELRAGDVLEMVWSDPYRNLSDTASLINRRYDWAIEKRISFPITLEIDGKPREIMLRGDLLAFDPTKDEAPMVDVATLVGLFLPETGALDNNVIIRRNGWNDISLPLYKDGAGAFDLQAGDCVVLKTAPPKKWGDAIVFIVSPNLPFSRIYGVIKGGKIAPTKLLPTLLQAVTNAWAPPDSWKNAPRENDRLFPWALSDIRKSASALPVILPHPDFSAIRIRRTDAEGKESVIDVNLTEAIARCTDATTPEEARASDMPLMDGDVVEIPVDHDASAPWTGFTREQTRFFHKALAGRVILNFGGGRLEQREIDWQPPVWRATPHGLLPLPPVTGIATTQLGALVEWSDATILREKAGMFNAGRSTFVRDGDQIDWKRPRPRVFAPPSPQPQR